MLPENNETWPPPQHRLGLSHMAEWSAWYSGDPDQLESHYTTAGRPAANVRPSQQAGGVVGRVARWWWGQPPALGESRTKLHVPLAADICGTSADLLFSESVKLTAQDDDNTLQEFLDDMQEAGLDAKLHEAAEVTGALGGGYLRVCWDRDRGKLPWTDTVHADQALPEFRWGRLHAVTFWSILPAGGADARTYRLLERHEVGAIFHGLYAGSSDNLGRAVPLEDHPGAAHLAPLVDADGKVPTGATRLTATYVPNMLPNRLSRGSDLGRSDLQGVTPLLDALDEAYSSWWRDIRHAKSRIFAPAQYLDSAGPGQPGMLDTDRELFVPISGVMAKPEQGLGLEVHQFTIRVAEHMETCKAWTERAIESAGYSTQSLSSGAGGAVTAAEVYSHERRSYMTRGKKVRYWSAGLREHLLAMAEVANANLGARLPEGGVSIEFEDGVQESAMSLASTAQAMRNAEAASTQVRVRMLHPSWSQEDVDDEVGRILAESGGAVLPVPDDAGL